MDSNFNINELTDSLSDCTCGRKHTTNIKEVAIAPGLVRTAGEILKRNGFPTHILLVADKNTLAASQGIEESLQKSGFTYEIKLYDNLRSADITEVRVIEGLLSEFDGCLSVGTGSLNDICRLASYTVDKSFAIFATAPSMDGFASGTSPITENNFKTTRQARQPSVIIADTDILAASPAFLKSAGFGDIIGKLIALVDWQISTLITGEYYCEKIADITREALREIIELAPRVTENDSEASGKIMQALVLTGLAMNYADSVRPASGAEHVLSHFWEIKKLEQGIISDFHGKKVGVATVILNRIYHEIASHETVNVQPEQLDWNDIYRVYGSNFTDDVKRLNNPTVTTETTPEKVAESWRQIRQIVLDVLPDEEKLMNIMKSAGAATTIDEIAVTRQLGDLGVKYHPYMRHRMTLIRLLPMLNIEVDLTCE